MDRCRIEWLRLLAIYWSIIAAASVSAQVIDLDEAKEKAVADRFVVVLEKNPRRGTALDKVYGFHVERGSLDGLISEYRTKTRLTEGPEAGSAWMIVGLLESLRGQDAAAVDSFQQAEKLATANYLAPYYLGQSLVLVGQPDLAAEAFERSIQRKPAQSDLLEIFQSLGRVYQRAQKTNQALEVWNRLEKKFPNDPRVQEQIATTLLEENEFVAALPRYEKLAKTTKDKYRQSLFQMEAAEIKVRMGKSDEAIAEFEQLLGQLNPDNWLYREVRRRIEAVYLRTDDQTGLISYYEGWIKRQPADLEAMSRLARLLAGFGRGPEAQAWLQQGLKVAPKKKELRIALIGQLTYEQQYAAAIAQYEQLDKYEPNNPDTLRDWGRLILKDTGRDEETRKTDAAAVWQRLIAAKPTDPLVASQVGELFRQADMTDAALALYRQAIALAPDQAQYREYLGEYLHTLERKEEALQTWQAIAAGNLKTAPNLARLAEVLASFGYLAEAAETNAAACRLDSRIFSLQVKQVDLLAQAEKHDEAHSQLAIVSRLAANDEEREAWLARDLRELQALDQLKDRIATVAQELQTPELLRRETSENAEQWFWLARAYEAERQLKDAGLAITKAMELAPQSVVILMASARIQEAQNQLLAAVEIYTKLAAIDRRYRTEYLKQIATLEQKLGRRDKALQAGRDLIAAAPGNPELYEFFSQLCFQLGETEEGLSTLRRSVRVNPTEPKGLLLLASALAGQFRTSEAIELYWRAFEKAANLDDRLGVVPKLTELYLQTNQFDRFLERLERQRREPNQQREMTICIAEGYQSAGDDGSARQELEKLLTEETRDTRLLMQLVKLCESDGDLEAAVKFQQQLLKAAPGKDGTIRLAQLLMTSGETDEANGLISSLTAEEKDPETVLKSLDSLLAQENHDQALRIIEKLARDQPRNWELLYREGVALAKSTDKAADARTRFEAILGLKLGDDEMALSAKSPPKVTQGRMRSHISQRGDRNPLFERVENSWQIREAVGLDEQDNSGGQQQPFWVPQDFGAARMASFGWLNSLARHEGREDEFLKQRRNAEELPDNERELTDRLYEFSLMNNAKDMYEVLKKLSRAPDADVEIKSMYLSSLSNRGLEPGQEETEVIVVPTDDDEPEEHSDGPKLAPLDSEELHHVLDCYQSIDGGSAMMNYSESLLQVVVKELERAGRREEADKMLRDAIDSAREPAQIAALLPVMIKREDFAVAMELLERLAAVKADPAVQRSQNGAGSFNYVQYILTPEYQAHFLSQLMARRGKKLALNDVLALWDRYLPMAVARHEQLKSTPSAGAKRNRQGQAQSGQRSYVVIWRGANQQTENLDVPTPNEIYDQAAIQMLRQAFVIYNEAKLANDLIQHFQQKLADTTIAVPEKVFWRFGLGYLHWWLDDKDEALSVLNSATDMIAENQSLKLEMARLHEKRGEHEAALDVVDSLPATDQQMMQQREIMALRLAVNGGNIDRARLAAERLFGLRLDAGLQIQLAQQMHQLGMHEQAEAVMARAGRQAGNKTEILASLMQQYQSQGKNEVATQIAHQLLRRSNHAARRTMSATRGGGVSGVDHATRQMAFTVLKRSGKLPEMIRKIEAQLQSSPKSQRLIETLVEYYAANGDTKKVTEMTDAIAESKHDDPQFRYSLGQQLMEQGKFSDAVEHFRFALKKDPRLMRNNFDEIMNSFEYADKLDELARILDDLDLKSFRQNPWELANMIASLVSQEKSKDRAVQLFKRAWKELPDQRQAFLRSVDQEAFWQMPEIYEYARLGVIPTETSVQQKAGWPGFGQVQSFDGDGRISTFMTRFLTIATTNRKLDELIEEIEVARRKFPNWEGGKTLRALVDLRRGKIDDAKGSLEKLLPTFKVSRTSYSILWEIGQELMVDETCIDLAIAYMESACKFPEAMSMNSFESSPAKALFALYKQEGRKDDARRVMLDAGQIKTSHRHGNEDYEIYHRVQAMASLGKELQELGFPVDAVRLFREQLSRSDDFAAIARVFGGGTQGAVQAAQFKHQIEAGFQSAIKAMKPELLPGLLEGAIRANDDPGAGVPVDLLLLIEERQLNKTTVSSAYGAMISGLRSQPQLLETARVFLDRISGSAPDDFGILILGAQLMDCANETEKFTAKIGQIVDLVDKTPLEPQLATGGHTLTQREAAMRQTALWLVARECLQRESHREAGMRLGERALEAAKRQTDTGFALAILREWGQLAFDAGDKTTAERLWSEMIEIVLPKPQVKSKKKEGAPADKGKDDEKQKTSLWNAERLHALAAQFVCQETVSPKFNDDVEPVSRRHRTLTRPLSRWEILLAPMVVGQTTMLQAVRAQRADPSAPKGQAVTVVQFEQLSQIATLAAEHGLDELSMNTILKALQAGPPVEPIPSTDLNHGFPASRVGPDGQQSHVSQKVAGHLAKIELVWRKNGVADEVIYDLLKRAVLPETRPHEIFLYPQRLEFVTHQGPPSLGSQFVNAALQGGKVDELKELIEPRLKQPLSQFPGRVLLAQLALVAGDHTLAMEQINALSKLLQLDSSQNSSVLACHAGIPALSQPDLAPVAVRLLEQAVERFTQSTRPGGGNVQEETLRTLRFALARWHFGQQNRAAGKQHLEDYLGSLALIGSSQFGGEEQRDRRREELIKVAAEYAQAGQQTDAMDCLGRYADIPPGDGQEQVTSGKAAPMILSRLAALPFTEQYELLKSWTLPTADRKSVRVIGDWIPADTAPAHFDRLRSSVARSPRITKFVSTADLLVEAASMTHQLDELQNELQLHAERNVENAGFLLLLTRIANGDGVEALPALQKFLDDRKAIVANADHRQHSTDLTDVLLARAAIADPSLRTAGREFISRLVQSPPNIQDHLLGALGRREYFSSEGQPQRPDRDNQDPWNTELTHWISPRAAAAGKDTTEDTPKRWVAHEGVIGHICDPGPSSLYFKYPLTGEFEIRCEAWGGHWAECSVGYGGIRYPSCSFAGVALIRFVGEIPLFLPESPTLIDQFNRVQLRIRPDKVRYDLNEHFVHEEQNRSPTTPWLCLHSERAWQTAVRNIRITGRPVIPREVRLSHRESLLGWVSDFYSESRPNRAVGDEAEVIASNNDFDWWAGDGEICGRQRSAAGLRNSDVQQSRLYYDRPLQDGEQIRYEFWYESGLAGCHVHPALDRLAFLIDEPGLKLHWMTDGNSSEDNYGDLSADNILEDASIQAGKISLKEKAWNAVEVSLKDNWLTLTLNGVVIGKRPLELDNSRQFGFYHDQNRTSVQVRNVILTGDWPVSLAPEITSQLFAHVRERSPAERRAFRSLVDERFHADRVDHLLLVARAMTSEDQYQSLKKWVLPNDDHSAVRLYGGFTSTRVGAASDPLTSARVDSDLHTSAIARRQIEGGELFAPVFDLVAVARKLERLDELTVLVNQIPDDSAVASRSRLAMQFLIEAARDDFDRATESLTRLQQLSTLIPAEATVVERWPEIIAGTEAMRHPQLRAAALALLNQLVEQQREGGLGERWAGYVTGLRDQSMAILETNELPSTGVSSPRRQWSPSIMERANAHGRGPVPRWQFRDGGVRHIGGDGHDYLYYQSPLRGSFTVEAELAADRWRETRLMYNGRWAGPDHTKTIVDLGNLSSHWTSRRIEPPLEFDDWCLMKLVVETNQSTYFINDRQVHQHVSRDQADPWLAIVAGVNLSGGSRSIRITGTPEVPDELNLSLQNNLVGWTSHLYSEPVHSESVPGDDSIAWKKTARQITSEKIEEGTHRNRQSILRYHRPLLEDSVVTYDFFYTPGQTNVHPTLGRVVLLLESEGIKRHDLTDAQWDRSEIPPDNATAVLEERRGPDRLPLKPDSWNHLQLTLDGDTIKLTLNDVDVYEAPVALSNQRQFGLFHFADETGVRVKNVTYRGNWPKSLPGLNDQELSLEGP